MNLDKLYKLQEELDKTILENELKRTGKEIDKDVLLSQTILALQVEVAELANATRCFKHWSTKGPNDKEPVFCELCDGTGDMNYHMLAEAAESNFKHECIECEDCKGEGIIGYKNPILEELADVWHFYLSLGNQLGIKLNCDDTADYKDLTIIFLNIYEKTGYLYKYTEGAVGSKILLIAITYRRLGRLIRSLGYELGFTIQEIGQAYMKKHEENYRRQEEGY